MCKTIGQQIRTVPFAIFTLHRLQEERADWATSIAHLSEIAAVELAVAVAVEVVEEFAA